MIWKTIVFLSFVVCALGKEHATSEQRVKIILKENHNKYGEMKHIGSKELEHHEEYAPTYPLYEFSYKVHDPKTHDIKGQEESRDGDKVNGVYWLVQPDGRKRIVKYKSDKHSGFEAAVHYEDNYHYEDKNDEKQEEASGEKESEEEESSEKGKESEAESPAESGEDARDAEESSDKKEDEGKWIHNRHWGYQNGKKYYIGKYDHDNDRYSHEYEVYEKPKYKSDYKDIESVPGHKAWHGAYDKSQESRIHSAYYPQQKNRAHVREHYVHPRLYRRYLN